MVESQITRFPFTCDTKNIAYPLAARDPPDHVRRVGEEVVPLDQCLHRPPPCGHQAAASQDERPITSHYTGLASFDSYVYRHFLLHKYVAAAHGFHGGPSYPI